VVPILLMLTILGSLGLPARIDSSKSKSSQSLAEGPCWFTTIASRPREWKLVARMHFVKLNGAFDFESLRRRMSGRFLEFHVCSDHDMN
jgi:hypothetical protein